MNVVVPVLADPSFALILAYNLVVPAAPLVVSWNVELSIQLIQLGLTNVQLDDAVALTALYNELPLEHVRPVGVTTIESATTIDAA